MKTLQVETSVCIDSGKVRWSLCLPGGGDTIIEIAGHLSEEDQESIAKSIALAFPPNELTDPVG